MAGKRIAQLGFIALENRRVNQPHRLVGHLMLQIVVAGAFRRARRVGRKDKQRFIAFVRRDALPRRRQTKRTAVYKPALMAFGDDGKLRVRHDGAFAAL